MPPADPSPLDAILSKALETCKSPRVARLFRKLLESKEHASSDLAASRPAEALPITVKP